MSELSQAPLPVPGVDVEQRLCKKCGSAMSIYKSKTHKKGWKWQCQPCRREYSRQKYADPAERERINALSRAANKRRYWSEDPEVRAKERESNRRRGTAARRKAAQNPEWQEKTAAYMSEWHYKRKYGLTPEDVDRLTEAQGGCAICGLNENWPGRGKRPHVDHCHETGRVRGTLCDGCNRGLGMFKDDSLRLQKAIRYLNGGNQDLIAAVLHNADAGTEHGGVSDASSDADPGLSRERA